MRSEYDFSNGVRGKFFGKTRVVGPIKKDSEVDATGKLRRSLEADLKKLGVLDNLDKEQRAVLRENWNRKIEKALAS
ncbi:MAG: hypothetical protein ABIR33_07540 [Pyrinomonadaceae bacterium]